MKRKYGFVALLLLALLFGSITLTHVFRAREFSRMNQEVSVVTSFYPMYIAAVNVIGETDGVVLRNLSEPQTGCLHDYQLTPADMELLQGADLFIVNGGGMENFLADVAANYPELTIICASGKIALYKEEEPDRSENGTKDTQGGEHEHGAYNAHAWMSVADYMVQVETIAEEMAKADPRHAEQYETNKKEYLKQLEPLAKEMENLRTSLEGQTVVLFHEAFDYIARDLDLNVAFRLDLDGERQVSAGDVAEVVRAVLDGGVDVVLADARCGSDLGNALLRETDAQVVYLDTLVTGDYEKESYINGMGENIRLLKEAFHP